jgi:hypothetical protein
MYKGRAIFDEDGVTVRSEKLNIHGKELRIDDERCDLIIDYPERVTLYFSDLKMKSVPFIVQIPPWLFWYPHPEGIHEMRSGTIAYKFKATWDPAAEHAFMRGWPHIHETSSFGTGCWIKFLVPSEEPPDKLIYTYRGKQYYNSRKLIVDVEIYQSCDNCPYKDSTCPHLSKLTNFM